MPRRKRRVKGRARALVRMFRLMDLLKRKRPQTHRQLARKFGVCERTIQRDLGILAQVGLRVRHETRKNGRRAFWIQK